jgi:hypothetical protein
VPELAELVPESVPELVSESVPELVPEYIVADKLRRAGGRLTDNPHMSTCETVEEIEIRVHRAETCHRLRA